MELKDMSYNTMEEGNGEIVHPVLVIGKSGNGKSTLCNALVGREHFPVGSGTSPETKTAEFATKWHDGIKLKVVDTPDITSLELTAEQMKQEVEKWQEMTQPGPDVVILTLRCDVKYTADEWAIYKEISGLWGDGPLGRLVVVFTFGDCQDVPIAEELKEDCPELQSVLRDAGWNYFVFDKTDEESRKEAVQRVVEVIQGEYTGLCHAPRNPPRPMPSRFVIVLTLLMILTAAGCIVSLVFERLGAAIACVVCIVILLVVLLFWVCCRREKEERLLPDK